jgi:hypothetical protein
MSWFANVIGWRSLKYLAAPLLVVGTLWWRGEVNFDPAVKKDSNALAVPSGRPANISAEQWHAARLDFEALTDGTLNCSSQEMPAYWRLLQWSHQPAESELDRAAFSRVSFNDLVNRPCELRGAAVQVDLHVCRVTSYDAPQNRLGIDRLYEVWGWSEDSRGSLYIAVTTELPAGLPTGEVVTGTATLCGYFYKVQGYVAAGSTVRGQLSAAPLIIGGLETRTAPAAALARPSELWLTGAGLVLAISFVWLLSRRPLFRFRHRLSSQRISAGSTARLQTWIDSESTGEPFPIRANPA